MPTKSRTVAVAANGQQVSTPRRRLISFAAALAGTFTGLPQLRAQEPWPNKPIRMLVGYTPGGFTDNMARAVGEPLARVLGQPILFDYKPGANSLIAVEMLAKAPADGYTLTTVIAAHSANPSLYPKMPFDAINDIVTVALTGIAPLILVSNIDFAPKTITELLAYVKARPGQFNFGSSGKGAAAHLAMEAFMSAHGLKMQHVPYKGTQPALTDLIGGQIQLLFDVPLAMYPQIKAGKIKALGMASEKRLPGYPDIATFAEGGVPYTASTWSMILAPAKTPKAIVSRVNSEVNKILLSPAVREKLESTGVVPGSGSPEDAAAFLAAEITRNAKVIQDAGVKLDG